MEDNNNIDSVNSAAFPEAINPKVPYIELEPENELNFIEGRKY